MVQRVLFSDQQYLDCKALSQVALSFFVRDLYMFDSVFLHNEMVSVDGI